MALQAGCQGCSREFQTSNCKSLRETSPPPLSCHAYPRVRPACAFWGATLPLLPLVSNKQAAA